MIIIDAESEDLVLGDEMKMKRLLAEILVRVRFGCKARHEPISETGNDIEKERRKRGQHKPPSSSSAIIHFIFPPLYRSMIIPLHFNPTNVRG